MRRKRFCGLVLTATILIGMLGGCGGAVQTAGMEEEAGQQGSESQAGQETDQSEAEEKGQTTGNATVDSLVGEWEFMCNIYHSDDSDGESYEYVTMCTDEYAPETRISISKEGDNYLANYLYREYDYNNCMIYGAKLQYKDSPAYEGAENASWCMELADPFAEEDSDGILRRFFVTDDDRLVVSNEYFSDPEEEYSYHSVNTDIYLRKDSPRFDDPEGLKYFDTVTVSNPVELLNSIQNNRKIIVKEGVYNFSDIESRKIENDRVGDLYGAYEVDNVYNLCIEAEEGADVQFCIDDPYSPVFSFSGGRNVTLRGLTVGHTVEPGYCSGSVLCFNSVEGIDIDQCSLYGSGTYGVEAQYSYNINVTDTDIYECTYGLVWLHDVGSAYFTDCTMRDSSDLSMIDLDSAYDVVFDNCEFSNNVSNRFDSVYFVEIGEYDSVTFRNCSFINNEFNAFSNREVTLENCTSDNNHAGFSDLLNSSVSEGTLDKEALLANYESVRVRQEEIDAKLQSDTLLDQTTLNQLAYEEYDMWDVLLNQIWGYLGENLETEKMDMLRDEQKKWIREKEGLMQDAGAGFEGGSMQPMVEYGAGATATQKRVEELVDQYLN